MIMDIIYTDLVLFPLKWGKGSLHPTYKRTTSTPKL